MKKSLKFNFINYGNITPALLVITGSFIIIIYGLLFILSLQFDYSHRQVATDKALNIAEAGINYYLWHLKEDPDDYQDGTGAAGPYEHDYSDPQADVIGTFSLEIDPPTESANYVTISSTGWTSQYPKVKRKVAARYGSVSLTSYMMLLNSSFWVGNQVEVEGPIFSNGGIRQDGTNESTVESSKATYTCGVETGCNPAEIKPGIWGNGEEDALWDFPAPPIDFDSIKVNFSQMKVSAQNNGWYLPPSGNQGYHLVFSDNGNVTVYEVTGADTIKGYSVENGCENLLQEITSESVVGTRALADNQIIFAEDNVWVDGVVNGKTTVVAAVFPLGSFNPTIWLPGIQGSSVTYLEKNGDHKLGLVSENDIVFGRDVPDEFEIDAALLAQEGKIIRHHYGYFGCKSKGTDKIKKKFSLYGSIISNLTAYWNFSSGPGSPAAGFQETDLNYDQSNAVEPPPYFPSSQQYELISWTEEKVN